MQAYPEVLPADPMVHPRNEGDSVGLVYLEPIHARHDANSPKFLLDYCCIFRRKLRLVLSLTGLGLLLGGGISILQTPTYQAKAVIEIQNPTGHTLDVRFGDIEADHSTVDLPAQIKILQSKTLERRVRAKLKMKFPRGLPVRPRWHVNLGSVLEKSQTTISSLPPVKVKAQLAEGTNLAEILCDSESPELAAEYANAITDEYIQSNLEARWDSINRSREWLTHQLEDVRVDLQKSEDQLQTYGRASKLMFMSEKDSVDEDKLKQIQEALSKAQAERIERESIYRTAMSATPDSVPEVLRNGRLATYQSQIGLLQQQHAQLTSRFTPEHYKVKEVEAQIEELQRNASRERENVLKALRNDYQSALMRERLLTAAYRDQAKTFSEQAERAISYNILKNETDTNRQLYSSLLQKAKEVGITSALHVSNVRVIDPAETPKAPYTPNLPLNVSLGAIAGLLLSIVGVLGRNSLDTSFKLPGETSMYLRLPELGVIPAGTLTEGVPRGRSTPSAMELAIWRDRQSIMAEAFRSLLTSLLYSVKNGTRPRVLLVSSAVRGEGKSTVVSNLGAALAEIEQRVLLIDADMREPRLHEVFNVPNTWGLSDLLREKKTIKNSPLEALARHIENGVHVLPSGPGPSSVTNLLYSSRMSELLQRFRSEFDFVLIDTPPILDISDSRILARLADAVILVVRAGRTSREAALAAKNRLLTDGVPVLGMVLNAWDLKSSRYGYPIEYSYNSEDART